MRSSSYVLNRSQRKSFSNVPQYTSSLQTFQQSQKYQQNHTSRQQTYITCVGQHRISFICINQNCKAQYPFLCMVKKCPCIKFHSLCQNGRVDQVLQMLNEKILKSTDIKKEIRGQVKATVEKLKEFEEKLIKKVEEEMKFVELTDIEKRFWDFNVYKQRDDKFTGSQLFELWNLARLKPQQTNGVYAKTVSKLGQLQKSIINIFQTIQSQITQIISDHKQNRQKIQRHNISLSQQKRLGKYKAFILQQYNFQHKSQQFNLILQQKCQQLLLQQQSHNSQIKQMRQNYQSLLKQFQQKHQHQLSKLYQKSEHQLNQSKQKHEKQLQKYHHDKKVYKNIMHHLSERFIKFKFNQIVEKSNTIKSTEAIIRLITWFNKPVNRMDLKYKGTQNQFSMEKYYKLCGDLTNTIILVKTQKDKILGGFTPLKLGSSPYTIYQQSVQDPSLQSFVFTLTQKQKFCINSNRIAILRSPQKNSIYFYKILYIQNNSNTNRNSYFYIGEDNYNTGKFNFGIKENYMKLTGNQNQFFMVKEIEVYQMGFEQQ